MVNIDNINLENLGIDDLAKLEERIKAAKMVPTGKRLVALTLTLKETMAAIKEIDAEVLGEALGGVSPQALPKHNVIAKRYGLSETQVKNEQEKAAKAVAAL